MILKTNDWGSQSSELFGVDGAWALLWLEAAPGDSDL